MASLCFSQAMRRTPCVQPRREVGFRGGYVQLDDAADGVVVVGAVALDAGVDDGIVVDVGVVDGGAGAGVAAGDVPRLGRLRSPSPQNRVQRRHCVDICTRIQSISLPFILAVSLIFFFLIKLI